MSWLSWLKRQIQKARARRQLYARVNAYVRHYIRRCLRTLLENPGVDDSTILPSRNDPLEFMLDERARKILQALRERIREEVEDCLAFSKFLIDFVERKTSSLVDAYFDLDTLEFPHATILRIGEIEENFHNHDINHSIQEVTQNEVLAKSKFSEARKKNLAGFLLTCFGLGLGLLDGGALYATVMPVFENTGNEEWFLGLTLTLSLIPTAIYSAHLALHHLRVGYLLLGAITISLASLRIFISGLEGGILEDFAVISLFALPIPLVSLLSAMCFNAAKERFEEAHQLRKEANDLRREVLIYNKLKRYCKEREREAITCRRRQEQETKIRQERQANERRTLQEQIRRQIYQLHLQRRAFLQEVANQVEQALEPEIEGLIDYILRGGVSYHENKSYGDHASHVFLAFDQQSSE